MKSKIIRIEKMSEEHNYSLVRFSDATFPKQYKSMNIVPSAWLVHAKNDRKKLLCPFPTKFTKSNERNLDKIVEKLKPPSSKWRQYHVEVNERARKFFEIFFMFIIISNGINSVNIVEKNLCK